jgi:lysozyme
MRVSSHAIALIQNFEGLRTKAYKADPNEKYYTIGYGHYGPDVTPTTVITSDYAYELLKNDVNRFASDLSRYMERDQINLTQPQFDAVLSFVYNLGFANLISSTLWKKLKAKDYKGASEEFCRWNKCNGKILKGLIVRREKEKQLFLSDYES